MLCELLGCDTRAPVPDGILRRCRISTRMLAGTSALMDFTHWGGVMAEYEELLTFYDEQRLLWDERIADVTSGLIEKEETAVNGCTNDPSAGFDTVIDPGELTALREEISALRESDAVQIAGETAGPEKLADRAFTARETSPVRGTPVSDEKPMAATVNELLRVINALTAGLDSDAFRSKQWTSTEMQDTRSWLHFVDFYVRSLDEMIKMKGNASTHPPFCDLSPINVVLKDFAAEVSETEEQKLEIELTGVDVEIDPRLLSTAGAVLRWMITDIYKRSEASPVGVSVKACEDRGAIHWKLSDNGGNFISDSRLDHEDQLAFYPGLKEVRKELKKFHSVLGVEPNGGHEVRFEFSMPACKTPESFVVWNETGNTFAVRSAQLCDLIPVSAADAGVDAYGEFLNVDHRRVPLLKLDVLFSEAPSGGDMIAIIGSLEKRVGFYVPDSGGPAVGIELESSIPVWQGQAQTVVEINGKRVALMDADEVLAGYLDLTGEMGVGNVSGGVLDDDSQAASVLGAQAPPDRNPRGVDGKTNAILVVEQSENLKNELKDILSGQKVRVTFTADVGEAVDLIRKTPPELVISEFRMPSMAAKVLVETLRKDGIGVPVLVTTSQSGQTADLLVGKLGAAGYLGKPLNRNEVLERINGFLNSRAGTG